MTQAHVAVMHIAFGGTVCVWVDVVYRSKSVDGKVVAGRGLGTNGEYCVLVYSPFNFKIKHVWWQSVYLRYFHKKHRFYELLQDY